MKQTKKKNSWKFLLFGTVIVLLLFLSFNLFYKNNISQNNSEGLLNNLFPEDTSCKYNSGENCQNAPSKCFCKDNQICVPDRTRSDNLGCYTFFCGDGFSDNGENSDNCCIDAGCPSGLVCDANLNQCVKPACPYDCCINDYSYQDKNCPQYYSCTAQEHSCKPDDRDNDALPDYKEIQLGTDLNNPDTDGDTVLDGYDNHPTSSYLPRTYSYSWRYDKNWFIFTKEFSFSITLSEDVVSSYENMPKTNLISRDDLQLSEVAQKMNALAIEQNYDDADKLMMVIAFSRSFNYDYTKASFSTKPLPDWANFPMETIVKKQGLCADSAVMSTTLLRKMGYDAQYLVSGPCTHAIIGVPYVNGITLTGSERYVTHNGQKYYYIDPTSRDSSGNIIYSTTSKADFGTTFVSCNDFFVSDY